MLGKALTTAAAGNAGGDVLGVEDVFSTWLYTGNGSTQTITNGIDLAGEGGLVWLKRRNDAVDHLLFDTARGDTKTLKTSTNTAQNTIGTGDFSFSSTGFAVNNNYADMNLNGGIFASWTFRKAPKFFDVVTYTGDGIQGRQIAHNLGSVPGCIIIKITSGADNWAVYHQSTGPTKRLKLNSTDAALDISTSFWNGTQPTSSVFSLGTNGAVNASGATYVAYLFAHDAGGFGDSGNESVIKCGSYTGNGSTVSVDLGWEPQWVMLKAASGGTGSWFMFDTMRGISDITYQDARLAANLINSESLTSYVDISATGFTAASDVANNGVTYIYIAIRRGPMKTPTDATTVFSTNTAATSQGTKITTSFPVDLQITSYRSGNPANYFTDRLRGVSTNDTGFGPRLSSTTADAESGGNNTALFWDNTGYQVPSLSESFSTVWQSFRRAPGFFDVVAYTGTGVARTVNHNLGVAPELMIVKRRSSSANWSVYSEFTGNTDHMSLNQNYATFASAQQWNNTSPTSSSFTVGTAAEVNGNTSTYIAYLFASCPGVSKVGSYTGTGTTLNIDCGFTNGTRFVLIKRTDSTGDWYVWDTARGIIAGNDPYLLLNSTAAEVTSTDYIDPLSSGFQISSTAPAAINANGGSFIYLAIA